MRHLALSVLCGLLCLAGAPFALAGRTPVALSPAAGDEDAIALFEELNAERGRDFFAVIHLLQAHLKAVAASSPARPQPVDPGFLGDLSRFLPPWL